VVGSKMTWNMAGCISRRSERGMRVTSARPEGCGTSVVAGAGSQHSRPTSQRRVARPGLAGGAASRSSLHVAAT
jgi:hypothetical protein